MLGTRRKGRVNVMGGLGYTDKKRVCYFRKKGDGDTFYIGVAARRVQLKTVENFVKKEWMMAGNQVENFEKFGPEIVIILDKASFHKRKDILEKIKKEMPKIILEFLPTYSPDYNLIELVCPSTKEYMANKLFKSVEELEELLNKLLNVDLWCAASRRVGELIIKWGRKIKNKGNAVY